jgi:hypothetical protein
LGAASPPPTPEKLSSDDIDESTLVLWSRSPERDVYLNRRRLAFTLAAVAVIVALVAALIGQPSASAAEIWWASIVAAVAVILLCCSAVPYVSARRAFRERQRVMVKARARIALFKMTKSDQIALADLFRYTRRQLDAYQEESRNQQRLAFRHAQLASMAGLAVLIIGIVVSLQVAPGSDKYVVAGLSGLGAALSGYVADTFIKTARLADEQMNLYYREPHMMGRLVVTERLARTLCESCKKEMGESMIAQALAWPLPGADGAKEAKNDLSHSPDQKGASREGT